MPPRLAWDGRVREFAGRCDASAAVAVPHAAAHALLIANDETEALLALAPDGSHVPLRSGVLRDRLRVGFAGRPAALLEGEADLEAMAMLGPWLFLVTSHGRDADGGRRPRREQLMAVQVSAEGLGLRVAVPAGVAPYRGLLADLAAIPLLGRVIRLNDDPAPSLAPERGGLNIEGLAAGADGASLLLGFRSPLTADGRAILLRLRNPLAVLTAAAGAALDRPVLLDLGGRGIRSLDWLPHSRSYAVVAGPSASEGAFALFGWSGEAEDAPVRMPGARKILARLPEDFHPEAVVVTPDGDGLWLLSDDGDRKVGGKTCKKQAAALRRFRGVLLTLG